MKRFDPRHAFAVCVVLFALGLGMVLSSVVQPVRAQFSAARTFVPAVNVGGTANAVTLAIPNASSLNDLLGVPIRFVPSSANAAGGTTVTVNSFSALNVERWSLGTLVPIADHDFSTASFAEVVYDGTELVQKNPGTGDTPVGHEDTFVFPTGSTISSIPGYLIENGQCVSETTYSALWAAEGDTDIWSPGSSGGACPSGEFHLKFANGRASVASNTQGSQTGPLTNCTAGVGETCGAQSETIAQAQLPNVGIPFTSNIISGPGGQPLFYNIGSDTGTGAGVGPSGDASDVTASGTTNSINGDVTQQALTTIQPINQNIFAVKY